MSSTRHWLSRETATACCPEDSADNDADFARRYENWKHYQNAAWWDSSFYRPDRADRNLESMASTAPAASVTAPASRPAAAPISKDSHREELVTARDKDADKRLGDVSPHLGGRAQPGDVLGVETGGEQTHVGETSDDENERRRDAEKAAAKRDRD